MLYTRTQIFIRFDSGGDSCEKSKFPAVELELTLFRLFSLTLYSSPSFCRLCSSLPNRAHRPPRGVGNGPPKHGEEAGTGIDTDTGTEGEKFNPFIHDEVSRAGLVGWEG
jgi:hypothetical protein